MNNIASPENNVDNQGSPGTYSANFDRYRVAKVIVIVFTAGGVNQATERYYSVKAHFQY